MGGTTTNYALRYPSAADPANVPSDMQNLASDVDAALFTRIPAVVNGQWIKGSAGALVWSAIGTADLPSGIPYSKLSLAGSVVNADIAAAAAIGYSKLSLAGSVTNGDLAGSIAASKLSGYPSNTTTFLRGDGSWVAPAGGPVWTVGTTPPGSPANGDIWVLSVDNTNGISWMFVYDSTQTTYKWRYIGGAPLVSAINVSESSASTSYTDLTTVGPSMTLPRAGDYDFLMTAHVHIGHIGYTGVNIAGAAAVDGDGPTFDGGGVGVYATVTRLARKNVSGASSLVKMQYRCNSGADNFIANFRVMSVTPVRVI